MTQALVSIRQGVIFCYLFKQYFEVDICSNSASDQESWIEMEFYGLSQGRMIAEYLKQPESQTAPVLIASELAHLANLSCI